MNRTWPADPSYSDGRLSSRPVYLEYLLNLLGTKKTVGFRFRRRCIIREPVITLSFNNTPLAIIDDSIVQGLTGPKNDIPSHL